MSPDDRTDSRVVELASDERIDLMAEVKAHNATELSKMRDAWDDVTRKLNNLQAELDSTHTLVQVTCAERDDLRGLLEKKQAEFRAEDQEAAEEMKKLLAELLAQEDGDDSEAAQKSAVELTRQVAAQIEKNLERLAKRAEVSYAFSPQLSACVRRTSVKLAPFGPSSGCRKQLNHHTDRPFGNMPVLSARKAASLYHMSRFLVTRFKS